jgi:hypothetical protein
MNDKQAVFNEFFPHFMVDFMVVDRDIVVGFGILWFMWVK